MNMFLLAQLETTNKVEVRIVWVLPTEPVFSSCKIAIFPLCDGAGQEKLERKQCNCKYFVDNLLFRLFCSANF